MIVGPNGEQLADPVIGGEGMVVAETDIARSIEQKMAHDIVGYYNRFDIFHLEFDPTPNRPIWIRNSRSRDEQPPDESTHVSQEKCCLPARPGCSGPELLGAFVAMLFC